MKFTTLFFFMALHALPATCQHAMVIHGGKPIRFTKHCGYIIRLNEKLTNGNFIYDENEFPTFNLKTFDLAHHFIWFPVITRNTVIRTTT